MRSCARLKTFSEIAISSKSFYGENYAERRRKKNFKDNMWDFATCTNEEQNVVPVAMLMADIRKVRIAQNKCVGCGKCIKICHKHAPVYVP